MLHQVSLKYASNFNACILRNLDVVPLFDGKFVGY